MATGFIAKNPAGQVTTLRRNGSDYSATIVGALLRSTGIVIWTDVDGVFSADPRKARQAASSSCSLSVASSSGCGVSLRFKCLLPVLNVSGFPD